MRMGVGGASAPGSSRRRSHATRFVYPCFGETTASAIEACEAAWAFYGGVFHVVIPDNTKAIITTADPLQPRLVPALLEYAQARGFVVDPARVRHPQDKARVERTSSARRTTRTRQLVCVWRTGSTGPMSDFERYVARSDGTGR
jgi:transposase